MLRIVRAQYVAILVESTLRIALALTADTLAESTRPIAHALFVDVSGGNILQIVRAQNVGASDNEFNGTLCRDAPRAPQLGR